MTIELVTAYSATAGTGFINHSLVREIAES
jgi:hypothetical protein